MATEVLRPQDLFADRRFRPRPGSFYRRRNLTNFAVTVNRNNYSQDRRVSPRSDRIVSSRSPRSDGSGSDRSDRSEKRRSPVAKKLKNTNESTAAGGLINGQVTILKRGEPLDLSAALKLKVKISMDDSNKVQSDNDMEVCGSKRIGPESPEMVPKQLRLAAAPSPVYAGAVFTTSPSPRALPLPSFFNRKGNEAESVDQDLATRDLRRMLRLE